MSSQVALYMKVELLFVVLSTNSGEKNGGSLTATTVTVISSSVLYDSSLALNVIKPYPDQFAADVKLTCPVISLFLL